MLALALPSGALLMFALFYLREAALRSGEEADGLPLTLRCRRRTPRLDAGQGCRMPRRLWFTQRNGDPG